MTDPIQSFLQANALEQQAFPTTSRYHGLATAQLTRPDGTAVTFVRRRFVPPPERFVTVEQHLVADGDRVDTLAARFLGDPEQFWRLCDGNGVMQPAELVETVGARVRITLPEGIPGVRDA